MNWFVAPFCETFFSCFLFWISFFFLLLLLLLLVFLLYVWLCSFFTSLSIGLAIILFFRRSCLYFVVIAFFHHSVHFVWVVYNDNLKFCFDFVFVVASHNVVLMNCKKKIIMTKVHIRKGSLWADFHISTWWYPTTCQKEWLHFPCSWTNRPLVWDLHCEEKCHSRKSINQKKIGSIENGSEKIPKWTQRNFFFPKTFAIFEIVNRSQHIFR